MNPLRPEKNSKSAKETPTHGAPAESAGDRRAEHYAAELATLFCILEPLIGASLYPKFDPDGFRSIKLSEAEWNFSSLAAADEHVVAMAQRHEYMREVQGHYEVARDLFLTLQDERTPAAFLAKWKWRAFWPLHEMRHVGLPLTTFPWMAINQVLRLEYPGETYSAVREIEADEIRPLWAGETRHWIEIDWNKGIKGVQSDLEAWAKTVAPKDVTSRRGRPIRQQTKDSLAQLAAWRARRAGLPASEFNELLDKAAIPHAKKASPVCVRRYADPSAYRNAATAAETRIKEYNRDYESAWVKTMRENHDYWGDNCEAVRDAIQRITDEAETFRVQMHRKKREAESFLSEFERSKREAEESRKR